MTPDRFERIVWRPLEMVMFGSINPIHAARLLRREHQAVKRKVKAMRKKHDGVNLTAAGYAYDAALEHVLEWLDRRAR